MQLGRFSNYFELLGLPVPFALPQDAVAERQRELQQVASRPFVAASHGQRRHSMQHATRVKEPMSLKWTDTLEIAMALDDARPNADPRYVNSVDLRQWVLALEEFDDDPDPCGERVLEAIQMAWIEERE